MTKRNTRIWIGLAIFVTAVAVGCWAARPLAPERLRAEVETLIHVAQARDASAMAEAFGQISKTCIECHRAYLLDP